MDVTAADAAGSYGDADFACAGLGLWTAAATMASAVFPAYLQCSEDLIAWANATPGVDYEVITETVNGNETAVRFRIFCNPLPTTQGPFTYLTPFTAAVGRGAIDQLTITNHGMVGAGRQER